MYIDMRKICTKATLALLMLLVVLSGCGGKKSGKNGSEYGMSEFEQRKYENTLKQLNAIYAEASDAAASGSQSALGGIRQEIEELTYDFNGDNMSDADRQKCQTLKDRINQLKANPDAVFNGMPGPGANGMSGGMVVNRQNVTVNGIERFPCWLNQGDTATISVENRGTARVALYNYSQRMLVKRWKGDVDDKFMATASGIYVIEINAGEKSIRSNVSVAYQGKSTKPHRQVATRMVDCKENDFLATPTDALITEKVWDEPKRIGLRGNLKSMFSGKSRSLVPVPVPKRCDALLYSMRVSTNENTVESDGKFADRLSSSYNSIRLFGVKVYERQSGSDIINRLLFNTRPPREEDAFCNLYVFANRAQAKKFQDGTVSSGNYKYDVDQSQMGTQSCNGRLYPHGQSVMYMGFENERMRYDNYIWLEVVALRHTVKYVRPIYY